LPPCNSKTGGETAMVTSTLTLESCIAGSWGCPFRAYRSSGAWWPTTARRSRSGRARRTPMGARRSGRRSRCRRGLRAMRGRRDPRGRREPRGRGELPGLRARPVRKDRWAHRDLKATRAPLALPDRRVQRAPTGRMVRTE
jgi:hypothetical protein